MTKSIKLLTAGACASTSLLAIDLDQIQIFGYGTLNYYPSYDYLQNYQSDPKSRSKIDFERFVLAPQFIIDENLRIVSEIEFERGGTGVTMEYDTLDEFGEFESEIEKGGEVLVEELYADFRYHPHLNFRVGHIIIPVGLNTQRHLPNLYFSAVRNRSETRILPDTWHENGILAYGTIAEKFNYQAMVMNGLNSEFFDSANWIKNGHQKRFEFVNSDDLAGALRVDYGSVTGNHIGFSAYYGQTGDNRNKSKLDVDAAVTIFDLHGVYEVSGLKLRALWLWGHIEDSEALSNANANLPNALEAKRTPVASDALAWFVEAGYNIAPFVKLEKELDAFIKYDFSDSMYETEGNIQDLDQYEQNTYTIGLNYFYNQNLVFKGEYATTSFGNDANLDDMDEIVLGMGYQF